MKAKIKHDKDFFYHFMYAHDIKAEADKGYFWNIFISGCDYHNWEHLGENGIKALDTFNRVYGEFYTKETYKIEFEQQDEYGDWVRAELDNNGDGYSIQDACDIKRQMVQNGLKGVIIELLKEGGGE